jgi:hypothetical protein
MVKHVLLGACLTQFDLREATQQQQGCSKLIAAVPGRNSRALYYLYLFTYIFYSVSYLYIYLFTAKKILCKMQLLAGRLP